MSDPKMLVTLTAEELRELVRDAVRAELENTREAEPAAMLTTTQAAKLLQVSSRTITNLIERGELRAVRVGGAWRIPRSALPGADRAA